MKTKKTNKKQSDMLNEQRLVKLSKVKFKIVSKKLLQSAAVTMQIAYQD